MRIFTVLILIASFLLPPAMTFAAQMQGLKPLGISKTLSKNTKLSYFPPDLFGKPSVVAPPELKSEPRDKKTIRKIKQYLKKHDGKKRRKRRIFT